MRPVIICLYFLFVGAGAFGQISGHVTDTAGKPVAFATAALLRSADSTIANSATANDIGIFRMNGVQPGTYTLRITAVGYRMYRSAVFGVSEGRQADLGRLIVTQTGRQLGEVVIRADKPQVQQTAEGVTVNVQNSIITQGSSAMDVLQRSPGVIVDQHNNTISLNGKTGVMVMIDGRLMRMSMDQLITLLISMSADNIDKIELMNTPPAKYDAEGNAGIINIVTKKNKKRGTNGSVTLTGGYGVYEKASAAFNVNHNTGKVNLYGYYSYWHNHDYGYLSAIGSENAAILGGQADFSYTGISKPISNYSSAAVGTDIKLDSGTTIGVSVDYWGGGNTNHPHNYGYYLFEDAQTLTYNSFFNNSNHAGIATTNLYLDKDMAEGQKLRADLNYLYYKTRSLSNSQSSFTDSQGNQAGGTDSLFSPVQRDFGNTLINVLVGKLDYSKQFNKKLRLEAGAKVTYSRTNARSGIENFENGVWVPDVVGLANNFITYEAIDAGYLTFNMQLDSATSLVAGARYEYSHNYTDRSADINYRVDRKLGRFFPSVFFTRKINDHSSWNMSYTERITRPSYDDLASYVSYNDPVSVFTGNPLLKPTITHNLKVGYNDHDYLFSLLFSRDNGPILGTQVTTGPVSGVVYLRPVNADWQNSITLQATIPVKISDWWDMTYTLTGGLRQYRISFTPQPFEKAFLAGSFNFSENFKLGHGLSAELSGYSNSPSYNANWRSYGNTIINMGVKKQLGKGSIKLSIADIFRGSSYKSDLGRLTKDAFNSKVHVNYSSESNVATMVKLTYYRSFGSSGNKNQEKRDSGAGEERSRL
ncbi:TonB-dependent receptor domain-containing protein [Mucilaginibacter ginsenosidivorans]|uniref:TonB-dependent receptor n=1 Tax=Mucilaginibacter ginsenosidivorans TaxID=398053 RepID=A0A5B8V015_9SPHI|nr:TonB-dependent receptor [Mucilaginibacter ginsenosidivorans]QEC63896.1 TonB-dependent receptor [Mucilaginibacter ginsenosidivorans]